MPYGDFVLVWLLLSRVEKQLMVPVGSQSLGKSYTM